MKALEEIYGDDLLYVFERETLKNPDHTCMAVLRDGCSLYEVEGCLMMHYSDPFEELLQIPMPGKNRKREQMLSLMQCKELMKKVPFGVLSFHNGELPYSVGLNHILAEGRIFFHCAQTGYKLTGIGRQAAYLVVEDLGVSEKFSTHNHQSVAVYGRLCRVTDFETKQMALLQLVRRLSPQHPVTDDMVLHTNILELEVDYISGKSHVVV